MYQEWPDQIFPTVNFVLSQDGHFGRGGGGGWHEAMVLVCLPLAAPIGLSPLLILTLCGPERVLVVSTEPPDDLSCLTTPGVGRPGDGAVARAVDQVHPDAHSESMRGLLGGVGVWDPNVCVPTMTDKIFQMGNFVLSRDGHFGLGGGGGAGRHTQGQQAAGVSSGTGLPLPHNHYPPHPPTNTHNNTMVRPRPPAAHTGMVCPGSILCAERVRAHRHQRLGGPALGGGGGGRTHAPLCNIPSGCCFFTGPWTVTRSSLPMLRRVAAFCGPLRPLLLLVSFPRSRSPVVGVSGLC